MMAATSTRMYGMIMWIIHREVKMTKKFLLLVGLALLASCSKDHISPEQPQTEVAMGAPASLALAGGLNISFGSGGQTPIDELDASTDDSARALDIFQKPDESFSFEINIEKYKNEKIQLFLRKAGSTDVTSILAPVKITQLPNGQYHMRIEMENVRPVGAADFTTGEWFITGFWGGGEQEAAANSTKHKVKDVSPNSPENVGDKVEMGIPLGFPWTKIVAVRKGSTVLLKHEDLKIQPMGVLLCLTPNNRTVDEIDLTKIDRELQGFAIGGYFDVSSAPIEGEFPKFERGFAENTENASAPVLPYNISIPSGRKASKPIYLWAIPTEDATTNYVMSFSFLSKERTSKDANINPADQFDTNGIATFTDRYTIDYTFANRPKHSQFFIKEMKIRTSPMITEYFINRVRNGEVRHYVDVQGYLQEDPALNDPYFYGYVEIYNPNLDGIDLSNYALCRIANIRNSTLNSSGTRVASYGPNFPYFHAMARKKFVAGGSTGDKGTADRNGDETTESNKALLLSLQLKDGQKSSFQPNSLGFKSRIETGLDEVTEAPVSLADNDDRIERVKFYKGGLTNNKAILKGGKTMLVLGNGFLETDTRSYTYYNRTSRRTERRAHSDNTLSNIADLRVKGLPQDVYTELTSNASCQMIVAVDNYKDKSTNYFYNDNVKEYRGEDLITAAGIDYYAVHSGSGVMNLGWHDALFIVQKHKSNSKRRRIVDATSANPFARVNNWKEFAYKVTLASDTELGKPHFRVRTVAQHLPEFLNFTEKQWHPALYEGTIPPKVSPGRRSAAN